MSLLDLLNPGRKKIDLLLQTEAAECGLACIGMIASHYGHKFDLNSLRQKHALTLTGATLADLINICDRLGMSSRPLQLELSEIPELQTPCILHWDTNHFVVLEKQSAGKCYILDPARGRQVLSTEETSLHFTGIALEVFPNDNFELKNDKTEINLFDFWSNVSGLKQTLIQLFVVSFLLQIFALALPFYSQTVIDDVVLNMDRNLLFVLAMSFGALALMKTITEALRSLIILTFGSQMSLQIGNNLFRHLIRLPIDFFHKRHMGDIISRFGSLQNIRDFLTKGLIQGIVDGIMLIGTLIMMLIYSPILTLVVSISVATFTAIKIGLLPALRRKTEESIMTDADQETNIMESIRGIQSIKLAGVETQRQTSWVNKFAKTINKTIEVQKLTIGAKASNTLLFGIENVLVIYIAATLILDKELTIGMMVAFLAYKSQFTDKASLFVDKLIEFKMLKLHLLRLSDIVLTKQEDFSENNTLSENTTIKGKVELRNISFRYSDNSPFLFQRLNLTILPGESIAITGPSGVGKTTLIMIILGLIEPTEGQVLIDGYPLSRWSKRHLRRQLGTVMQDDSLFAGSIVDNVTFSEDTPNIHRATGCLHAAGLLKDIEDMPMGLNTLVADMGSSLSGGQKQRLLLARALYREPKILLLDEATSHLDPVLEKTISENIKRLKITRILIAHRKETISSADRVVRLNPKIK